ncbi:inositol monophosphatase family protein [Rufibacter glacialis]|uniref:Inositol-1-monophosphatase n=1 Tax=Rufibacter glacialis TaxID=1259555 RepID=A0A5M8QVE5_9BACT|nr:inositol monophosphatase family protein [Rufibacter glacialis]KAA6438102.1 inositol monophosphatase [Rufibacter glacialis]GGK88576.1 inositol monophosphatase [Rufibacter glacialis]
MTDISALRDQVVQLTKEVGHFILQESAQFDVARLEHKGLNDMVSYVDKEAERRLVARLEQLLPQAGFITEEGTKTEQAEEFNWVIDPLDGTTNFIHGLPIFAVSIALLQRNELVLGVVHDICRDECFHAVKGGGAFCNGKKISVSQAPALKDGLIATGFPYYTFDLMPEYLKVMGTFMQSCHGLRRLGSAALDLAYVAAGRFEGYFEFNIHSYDVAAGALLVQEAGGQVTDFSGGRNYVFGRQICVSNNPVVQQEMLDLIAPFWQEKMKAGANA